MTLCKQWNRSKQQRTGNSRTTPEASQNKHEKQPFLSEFGQIKPFFPWNTHKQHSSHIAHALQGIPAIAGTGEGHQEGLEGGHDAQLTGAIESYANRNSMS